MTRKEETAISMAGLDSANPLSRSFAAFRGSNAPREVPTP